MPTPDFSPDELVQALSQTIPCAAIEAALDQTGKRQQRTRKLPSALIIQLIIALGLLVDMARRQVLAYLLPPASPLPGKMCLSRACRRVGPRPLIALFHALARPLAEPTTTPQAFFHGLRVVVLDAGQIDLPDSPANARAFGRRKTGRGPSGFPALKAAFLVEAGTHATLDLELRPTCRHEQLPGRKILGRTLSTDMLVLLDCGLFSYKSLATVLERGAQFLARVPGHVKLEPLPGGLLGDGSYLCRLAPRPSRQAGAVPLPLRVIEYRISGHDEVIRLATSLLDEKAYPALELAGLYHERWEVETFLDEIKTHQQGRPNGQCVAIHAQTPAGVVQEIYGLALAHRVVRTLMAGAAAAQGLDPDRLSFKNALIIVRRWLPKLAQARQKELPPLLPACFSRSARNGCLRARSGAISAG